MKKVVKENEYYENGKPRIEYDYHENGNLKRERKYYENGQPESDKPYNEKGNIEGTCKTWYKNGQPCTEVQKFDGVNHGSWKCWDSEGNLKELRTFIYDDEDGVSRYFGKRGKEVHEYYLNGKHIYFKPEQAKLMAVFLENLGYKVESPPQKKKKEKEQIFNS